MRKYSMQAEINFHPKHFFLSMIPHSSSHIHIFELTMIITPPDVVIHHNKFLQNEGDNYSHLDIFE